MLSLVQQIAGEEAVLGTLTLEEGRARAADSFCFVAVCGKNPGMVRMMVGDALQRAKTNACKRA